MSRYALELAREMTGLREDVSVALQARMRGAAGIRQDRLLVCGNPRSAWHRILMEQFSLPVRGRRFRLAHYPNCAMPMAAPWPTIVTCHDLSFLVCPGMFTRAQLLWKRASARRVAKKAARILCDSRHTAADVQTYLGVGDERVRVAYPGVRPWPGAARRPSAPLPEGPFILAVGTLEPRKNYERLIEAVAMLRREGFRESLVIAGSSGWLFETIFHRAQELSVADAVFFVGSCHDAEIKWLYERAAALAYVSIYEGFGFPPVEAMGYGLPVVASRVSSMPEVCGEAARYVNALSVEDIARGLAEALSDKALRVRLTAAGRERAQFFDWRRTALAVSSVYDELLQAV
ncbi:MAG: glycosyltransferase family 4 protein [Candidatus Brocadiia bacterium]